MVEPALHLDARVVYLDLQDALASLDQARGSPRDVRRAFSRFVELSQRLTSAMRKDYSRVLQQKWQANNFSEWSALTELLKYLRNQDQHGKQVFITVCETQYYSLPNNVEIPGFKQGDQLIVRGTWAITDHMLTSPPEGLELYLSDPGIKKNPKDILLPSKVEYKYILLPRDEDDKQRFENCNASDVHSLADNTFATLTNYYEFFCNKIRTGA